MTRGHETLDLLKKVEAGEVTAEDAMSRLGERRPLHVVTVRVPASLHERAKEACRERRQSLNQFCLEAIESRVARSGAKPAAGDAPDDAQPC